MTARLEDIDPKIKRILLAYPVRARVRWRKRNGIAVITYEKNLTKFERNLQRTLGGPDMVSRTMDENSTIIWEMCDGRHNVKEICDLLYERYREEVEPVFEYVHRVLQVLLERGLLRLEKTKPERPLPLRKHRVLKSSAGDRDGS